MQLGAINTINFESAKNRYRTQKKHKNENTENKQSSYVTDLNDIPAYKPIRKSNKFRNTTMALAAATAMSAPTGALMNSCTVEDGTFDINIDSNTDVDVNVKLYPVNPPKPDTIYVHDTINNTVIDTIVVKDTVFVKEDFDSEPIDTINKNVDSLDIDTVGKGRIPYMITFYDPWNLQSHKQILDMDASSKKEMVYTDEIMDYYEDKNNPKTLHRRVRFSVDKNKGLVQKIEKPIDENDLSDMNWTNISKTLLTNLPGKIKISEIKNGKLTKTGSYVKGFKPSSVQSNFIIDNKEEPNHLYEQMKVYYCNPSKEANYGKPYVEVEE